MAKRASRTKPTTKPDDSRFVPVPGSYLVVHLPGEIMRCRVDQVIDADAVIIEIDSVPMSRSHMFRKGDKTGARRRIEFGRDIWEALHDRDFLAGRSPNVPPTQPAEKPEKPKPTRRRAA